jgi:hypothetical protein
MTYSWNFTTTWIVTVETKDTHVRIVDKHFGIRITYIGTGDYTRRLRLNIDVMPASLSWCRFNSELVRKALLQLVPTKVLLL